MAALTIGNLNSVFDGGFFVGSPAFSNPITINNEGFIFNFGGGFTPDGLHLAGGGYTVTVNGVVGSGLDDGIEFNSLIGTSKLTVGTTGYVFGQYGVYAQHAVSITNNGFIEGVNNAILHEGNGIYSITNAGQINSLADSIAISGSGTHTINNLAGGIIAANGGFLAIDAGFSGGIQKVTNAGEIFGGIDLGAGNDTMSTTGSVSDYIDMGSGNDALTGGNFKEFSFDNFGADKYALGGGNDYFDATGIFGTFELYGGSFNSGVNDGFIDTVDGGVNTAGLDLLTFLYGDIYDASGASFSVVVNMDTVARTNVLTNIKHNLGEASGFEIGVDKVKNFETILTGSGDDVVFGNASANYILGGAGFDDLYGGAGNDIIIGGADSDVIFGDAGRDVLNGGGADNGFDLFVYRSVTESTAAYRGRDVIEFFEDGFDTIDFSFLNLNNPAFIGVDNTFSNLLGLADVRVLSTGSGWTIQLDKNGDTKVDMSIDVLDLAHTVIWDSTDFSL